MYMRKGTNREPLPEVADFPQSALSVNEDIADLLCEQVRFRLANREYPQE